MIKHPNCSTRVRPEKCDDLYCPIHGRIRNMDAGASPFVNSDEVFQEQVRLAGLTEEDILQIYREHPGDPDPLSQRLRREANEADARNLAAGDPIETMAEQVRQSSDALDDAIPDGCLCTWSNGSQGPRLREVSPNCTIHRADVEGSAEEDE